MEVVHTMTFNFHLCRDILGTLRQCKWRGELQVCQGAFHQSLRAREHCEVMQCSGREVCLASLADCSTQAGKGYLEEPWMPYGGGLSAQCSRMPAADWKERLWSFHGGYPMIFYAFRRRQDMTLQAGAGTLKLVNYSDPEMGKKKSANILKMEEVEAPKHSVVIGIRCLQHAVRTRKGDCMLWYHI